MRRLLLLLVLALLAVPAHAAAADVPFDVDDAFYRWGEPLAQVAPGTVLRSRQVDVAAAGLPTGVKATQVLYRTTKQDGTAIADVATILRPAARGRTRLLSYQTAYDDLGSTCTPSYTLRGGKTSGPTSSLELGFMLTYLAQGYTVVTADYEGLSHDYTAGQGAGRATLDGIRAARSALGVPATTPTGLVGYSGGAIATEWASELAPTYAPETSIVGAAAGGVPVDYGHVIEYVDGTEDWSSVYPWMLTGLSRGTGVDLSPYLSQEGRDAENQVAGKCLATGAFPGLHIDDMLAGGRDWKTVRPLVKVVNAQTMGTAGTPRAPLLLGNGNADGTGDGVMPSADVEGLAHAYCERGLPVRYSRYGGADHIAASFLFETDAIAFLQARFDGAPVSNDCARIPPGAALTPLPVPPKPRLGLTVRRTRKGYRLTVRLDHDAATLEAVRLGGRRLHVTRRPGGRVTTTARVVRVRTHRRAARIVVSAIADGERVTARWRR